MVMTINGKAIPQSEFVYSYKKNNGPDVIEQKTVKEYVNANDTVMPALRALMPILKEIKTR